MMPNQLKSSMNFRLVDPRFARVAVLAGHWQE
jgi:hypothetical protein